MTIIYVDGSCVNNGTPNAVSAVGVYFGDGDKRNFSGKLCRSVNDNNVAELEAIRRALIQLDLNAPCDPNHLVIIRSDSQYAVGVVLNVLKAGARCSSICNAAETEIANDIFRRVRSMKCQFDFQKINGSADNTDHNKAHNLAIAAARS
ncbi:Ribonuclease H1 [Coemansia sp. RSA 988]|nr:Ribonuclease H1 [Coemansia sp. RSA 988]